MDRQSQRTLTAQLSVGRRRFEDGVDRAVVDQARELDLRVGPHSRLIRLIQTLGYSGGRPPRLSDVRNDDLWRCGLYGWTHLVDVGSDDPESYRFQHFGHFIYTSAGRDFNGRQLREFPSRVLQEMAMSVYKGVKTDRRSDLALVEFESGSGFQVGYSRLLVPLTDDRDRITHVLMSSVRHYCRELQAVPAAVPSLPRTRLAAGLTVRGEAG